MRPRPAGRPRAYVQTLGCPKNEADSRSMKRSLALAGVSVVEDPAEATHILVNTCGFIREAKEESIAAILDTTATYPDKQIVVMGCLVERYRDELREGIPEVAGWFGLVGGPDEEELIRSLAGGQPSVGVRAATEEEPELRPSTVCSASYAYVKISDGCDELCTFCAIPGIKGPYHALTPSEILGDADGCLGEGARELVLVGQDTARWASGGMDLVGLAKSLVADPRLAWLRIMYLQPEHVAAEFLEYMAGQQKLCHYLDIPLQHSHPEVLRRMGRAGDADSYLDLLAAARRLMPDVALRSTFIVGFPGETEAQFEHLLEFVRQAEFDYAGGFVYSPEEGTPGCRLKPAVPRRVARQRLVRLNQALAEVAERLHTQQIGSTVDVMIDSLMAEEQGALEVVGRTQGQAPEVDGVVYIEGALPPGTGIGDVVSVRIEAVAGYDLIGTVDAP